MLLEIKQLDTQIRSLHEQGILSRSECVTVCSAVTSNYDSLRSLLEMNEVFWADSSHGASFFSSLPVAM